MNPVSSLSGFTEAGSQFFGDYELLSEIARGGMGVVYRARQLSLNRPVAIKMILDSALGSKSAIRRFQNEAEAAAKLHHPNIVPIHEIGEYRGRHFLSMDFIDGRNLAEPQPEVRSGVKAAAAAAQLLIKIAHAVQHAHERGVLHRDLKPGNILIDAKGEPHVTDFGLAKLVDHDSRLTLSGTILGTPAYMAPEQAGTDSPDEVTIAVDVYGLGAILYHVLVGQPPFGGKNVLETLRQVAEQPPEFPAALRPNLPRDLSTICLKALSKKPEARYRSAAEFAEDLERFCSGEIIQARVATPMERLWSWCHREPLLAGLSVALVLCVISFAILASVAFLRIKSEKDRVVRAGQEVEHRLFFAYADQARSLRRAAEPGWRSSGLEALSRAARIGEALSLPLVDVRTEAAQLLIGSDARVITNDFSESNSLSKIFLDPSRDRYLVGEPSGAVSVRAWDDHHELLHLVKNAAFNIQTDQVPVDRFWAISPDGLWVSARFADGSLRLRPLSKDRGIWQMGGLGNIGFGRSAFSPDSTRVAYAQEPRLLRMAWLTNLHNHIDVPFTSSMERFQWSPCMERLGVVTAGDATVQIVETVVGKVTQTLSLSHPIRNFSWHPNEATLAVVAGDELIQWQVDRETSSARRRDVPPGVRVLSFSPDGGRLVVVTKTGEGVLFQMPSGRQLMKFKTSPDPERVQFLRDGAHLALSYQDQRRVQAMEVSASDIVTPLQVPAVREKPHPQLYFSGEGEHLHRLGEGEHSEWEWKSGEWTVAGPATATAETRSEMGALLSGKTLRVVPAAEGPPLIVKVSDGTPLLVLKASLASTRPVVAMALSPSERFLAMECVGGALELWDLKQLLEELKRLGLGW